MCVRCYLRLNLNLKVHSSLVSHACSVRAVVHHHCSRQFRSWVIIFSEKSVPATVLCAKIEDLNDLSEKVVGLSCPLPNVRQS
jgi:hypothetical protein